LYLIEDYDQLTGASLNIYTTNNGAQWLAEWTYHIRKFECDEEERDEWLVIVV